MNKTILFLILLSSILAACAAPQVTVTSTPLPSETPIPTPTLHPQFAEIQAQVSASGGRFTLQPDGTIQDGAETIPGINVSSDGTMTLTINGDTVTLDPADVNFDDENGISIVGYEWDEDEGAWLEAISEARQAAEQHFADLGYPTDDVEYIEGEVNIRGVVDGRTVFTMNIKSGEFIFDQDYVEAQVSQMKLDPSDLGPREDILKATGQYFIDQSSWTPIFEEYVKPLMNQFEEEYGVKLPMTGGPTVSFIMLDPEINAWATMLKMDSDDPKAPRYLYYRDEAGRGYIVPLMPEK